MHTLRTFYCHELYLLCCRHVLIFTPESFSFIGKCFHASPLSVFIDRFISTSYNHDSYFY